KCGCLAEGAVVAPRHANCATAADKFHASSLPHSFAFPENDRTDLPARADVSSAARRHIEIRDLDQSQFVALRGRQFAQAEPFRFRTGNIANPHRTILKHNLIGPLLGPPNLLRTYRWSCQINRAIVFPHVERDRRHLVKLDKSRREHMLSGVLLHVIVAAFGIDAAMHRGPRERQPRRRFQVVDDPAVFCVGNFCDAEASVVFAVPAQREPSSVMHLAAAGRIKRRFPQDDRRARLLRRGECYVLDNRIEFVNFRAVVIKTFGHDRDRVARTLLSAPRASQSQFLRLIGFERVRLQPRRKSAQISLGFSPLGDPSARRKYLSATNPTDLAKQKSGTGEPLHTKEPVTVASFRTWRGWRENVARNRCLTLHIIKRAAKTGMAADFSTIIKPRYGCVRMHRLQTTKGS